MKFLALAVLFCLAASTLGGEQGDPGKRGPSQEVTIDAEGNTVIKQITPQEYALNYLTTGFQSMIGGFGQGGGFKPAEGTVNFLVSGVVDTARGAVKTLEPGIQAVYATPIPTIRILLAALKIKVCGPQTHLEYLLNHVVCFVNGPGRKTLDLAPLPICIPNREVQCWGPYLRVPLTLSPEKQREIGINVNDLISNVELVKIEGGNQIPVRGKSGVDGELGERL